MIFPTYMQIEALLSCSELFQMNLWPNTGMFQYPGFSCGLLIAKLPPTNL